jgi:DNA-directed RNA polymerase subunit delta
MYSQGETFYYDIDDEEFELSVVENITMKDKEYIIAEDYDGELHVFIYDEDEEEIYLLEDSDAMGIIEYWQDEYMGGEDIGDYEDDEYYDREDEEYSDKYDNEDYYEDDEEEYY